MRRTIFWGLMFIIAASQVDAKSFVYSYRGTSKEDVAIHTCIGTLTDDGKVTSKEAFSVDDLKMYRSLVGASGDVVVFNRPGSTTADWLDLKTMKLNKVADDFQRAIFITSKEMVYLAKTDVEEATGKPAVLKRFAFADGTCSVISDKVVLEQLPQQFVHKISEPLNTFWGVFLVDKKKMLGSVELSSGKFTSIAEMPADALSNDISPDGSMVLIGVSDFDPTQGSVKGESLSAKLVLIDVKTGENRVLARSLHQQVPGEGNARPRFTAIFTDNEHIIYPETVISGQGEIAYQRLVSMELTTRNTSNIGFIKDASRLVNAIPLWTKGGDMIWGEFKVDPATRKVEKSDPYASRGYSISSASELTANGKIISYLTSGAPIRESGDTLVFVGTPEKAVKPRFYVYKVGSDKAIAVNPENTAVADYGFID